MELAPTPKSALPATESSWLGEVVPIPILPLESIMSAVEVEVSVDVEIVKRGAVFDDRAAMERLAHGVVVPMPIFAPDRLSVVWSSTVVPSEG